ncbi:MAG: alanine racemase [Verrucomicrobiota bacterium]
MDTTSLRSWCEIDLSAFEHNLRTIREVIGNHPEIMAIVKADAYGHGLKKVVLKLKKADCQMIGVASLSEANEVRKYGCKLPILLLSAALRTEYAGAIRAGFLLTLSSIAEARELNREAVRIKRKAHIHLKVDTGMGRLGVSPADALPLKHFIETSPNLALEGIYSHFASADTDNDLTKKQWSLFQSFSESSLKKHFANSAALLNCSDSHLDLVRPGLAFYGISSIGNFQKKLIPALSWKSRITLVKNFAKGKTISYGATYKTPRQMKIAIISVGYGDGYLRYLSNRGQVLVNGTRCPILGRVTMDQIMVDVTKAPEVDNGTEVTLIGQDRQEKILASHMATWAKTIPYEIWTHITPRVPRIYRTRSIRFS